MGATCYPRPPDIPVCVPLNNKTGFCTYTISDKQFQVDNELQLYQGKTWDELKQISLITPPSSWAEIKKFILEACKQFDNCDLTQKKIEILEAN